MGLLFSAFTRASYLLSLHNRSLAENYKTKTQVRISVGPMQHTKYWNWNKRKKKCHEIISIVHNITNLLLQHMKQRKFYFFFFSLFAFDCLHTSLRWYGILLLFIEKIRYQIRLKQKHTNCKSKVKNVNWNTSTKSDTDKPMIIYKIIIESMSLKNRKKNRHLIVLSRLIVIHIKITMLRLFS